MNLILNINYVITKFNKLYKLTFFKLKNFYIS